MTLQTDIYRQDTFIFCSWHWLFHQWNNYNFYNVFYRRKNDDLRGLGCTKQIFEVSAAENKYLRFGLYKTDIWGFGCRKQIFEVWAVQNKPQIFGTLLALTMRWTNGEHFKCGVHFFICLFHDFPIGYFRARHQNGNCSYVSSESLLSCQNDRLV